jgi:dTDP-4-amino-4,6-dideoxygalactose transaminase
VKVPFFDLTVQMAEIRAELLREVEVVLDSADFILGRAVARFEESFAAYVGRRFCVGVNSGTSALHLALLAAGVGPGDEVVTTPFTWISTSWAVSYCGAQPVYADIDPHTGCLDAGAAERAITGRTKALLPVDLYGNPADLEAFERLAERHGIVLVEDAAQAHGARLHGRRAGSFGMLSCFSFYPGKNLGAAGEAGAVLTDEEDLARRIRRLRDHAQEERHRHFEIGFNYRMEGLQGAALNVKLRHIERWNQARRRAAARYQALLAEIRGVSPMITTNAADPAWHLYVIRVAQRDQVARCLAEQGIGSAIHYPTPVHLQPAYAGLGYRPGDLPAAETLARECLSLPMFPEITPDQQEHVAAALRQAVESINAG